jgi:hypothetical protein
MESARSQQTAYASQATTASANAGMTPPIASTVAAGAATAAIIAVAIPAERLIAGMLYHIGGR